jgi:hypothetical protein
MIVGTFIYCGFVILPPRFLDARWEFDAMGLLANNSLLPLLGIALVLHGRAQALGPQSLFAFRVVVIACFVMGALNLFLVPAAASDQQRLLAAADAEFASFEASNTGREENIAKIINGAATMQQLESMASMLGLAPTDEERRLLRNDGDTGAFKKWLQHKVQSSMAEPKNRAAEQYGQKAAWLQKDCYRIIAVNILASCCYFALALTNIGLLRRHVPEPADRA